MNRPSDVEPHARPPEPPRERLVDRETRNPWLRWTVHVGAPLGASLAFHVVVMVLFSLATVVAARGPREQVGEYEAGIADESLARELAGEFKFPEEQALDMPEDRSLEDLADLTSVTDIDVSSLDTNELAGDAPGLGFGDGRGDILGIGSGAGEAGTGGFGSGLGSGGRAGGGPVGMWGASLLANKIAYVIDFSGSITVSQDDLVRELKRSIGQLKPPQAFNVFIFYSDPGRSKVITESFKQDLQVARPEIKREFITWIDSKQPQGGTEPLEAIKQALRLEPEVIFFLSDGLFDERIVDQITEANKKTRAKLWCFVFDEILLEDTSGVPRPTDGSRRLQRLAQLNNGRTKIVTGADLDGR